MFTPQLTAWLVASILLFPLGARAQTTVQAGDVRVSVDAAGQSRIEMPGQSSSFAVPSYLWSRPPVLRRLPKPVYPQSWSKLPRAGLKKPLSCTQQTYSSQSGRAGNSSRVYSSTTVCH